MTPSVFRATHGPATSWSTADFETYEHLVETEPLTAPRPQDPRTTLQQVREQLLAARRQLLGSPSRTARQEIAERLQRLEAQATRLGLDTKSLFLPVGGW